MGRPTLGPPPVTNFLPVVLSSNEGLVMGCDQHMTTTKNLFLRQKVECGWVLEVTLMMVRWVVLLMAS